MNIKELITEQELEILLTALREYEKKCKGYANRKTMGYGKVSEEEKKREWLERAGQIAEIETKIAYEFI